MSLQNIIRHHFITEAHVGQKFCDTLRVRITDSHILQIIHTVSIYIDCFYKICVFATRSGPGK